MQIFVEMFASSGNVNSIRKRLVYGHLMNDTAVGNGGKHADGTASCFVLFDIPLKPIVFGKSRSCLETCGSKKEGKPLRLMAEDHRLQTKRLRENKVIVVHSTRAVDMFGGHTVRVDGTLR